MFESCLQLTELQTNKLQNTNLRNVTTLQPLAVAAGFHVS